jgi:hypothetical protein
MNRGTSLAAIVAVLVAGGAGVAIAEISRSAPPVVTIAELSRPAPSTPAAPSDQVDLTVTGCNGAHHALSPDYVPDRDDLASIGNDAATSPNTIIADAGERLARAAEVDDGVGILSAVANLADVCHEAGY